MEPPSVSSQHHFLDAAKHYDFATVRATISENPLFINCQPAGRWSALHQASEAGDEATVRFLLEKGASINVRTKDGKTPIDVAANPTIKSLLTSPGSAGGMDVDDIVFPSVSEQHSFLDAAKHYAWETVVAMVKKDGNFVNVQPSGRWSALHHAAKEDNLEMVKFLLERGANIEVKTSDGQTPLALANNAHVKAALGGVASGSPAKKAKLSPSATKFDGTEGVHFSKLPTSTLAKSMSFLTFPKSLWYSGTSRMFLRALRSLPQVYFGEISCAFTHKFLENVSECTLLKGDMIDVSKVDSTVFPGCSLISATLVEDDGPLEIEIRVPRSSELLEASGLGEPPKVRTALVNFKDMPGVDKASQSTPTLETKLVSVEDEHLILKVKVGVEDHYELLEGAPLVSSSQILALWEPIMSNQIPEGVACVGGLLWPELIAKINASIDFLKAHERPDYHPGSKNVVRDLVHPSLYPLVREAPGGEGSKDLWGRPYESSKYQWLPAEVDVSETGSCAWKSYINNLDETKYSALYGELAVLLGLSLPYLEAVWGYATTIRFHDGSEDGINFDDGPAHPQPLKLKGRRLQVIVKIVDYELSSGMDHEGVWHVEGMSHENIVASVVYIMRKDEGLLGANLQFKRAFLEEEAGALFEDLPQCRPAAVDSLIKEGLVPLGTALLPAGQMVCFPNSHVHRLSKLTCAKAAHGGPPCVRRVVVFWLVNPDHRITSTQDVPAQQGSVAWEQAQQDRLHLMEERKLHKQDWNVREISLCEH